VGTKPMVSTGNCFRQAFISFLVVTVIMEAEQM
jgi:hypothetical protein